MLHQSKELLDAVFAPIRLDEAFPVSSPDHTLRAEVPIEAHVHDCFEIGYCYRGSGIFIVENKFLSFQAGDAVVVNHRELHTMKGSPGSLTDWYFVNLAPAELLAGIVREDSAMLSTGHFSGPEFNNVLAAEKHPELCNSIRRTIDELLYRREGYHSAVRALVWEMMVLLHRILPADGEAGLAPGPVSRDKLALVTPAIRLITRNYHEPISIEALAEKCGYSCSNFRKTFHAATGYSPQDYLKRLRLEAVSSMLRNTDEDILSIALKSGYATLSNFNRQFQAHFGMSPREWRAKENGTPSRPAK